MGHVLWYIYLRPRISINLGFSHTSLTSKYFSHATQLCFYFYSLINQTYQLTIPVMISHVSLNMQNLAWCCVQLDGPRRCIQKEYTITNRHTLKSTLIAISDSLKYIPEGLKTTNSHYARHISFVFFMWALIYTLSGISWHDVVTSHNPGMENERQQNDDPRSDLRQVISYVNERMEHE